MFQQVLLGARIMAANRLASNSKKWYEVFSRNNSGTGNKQWLVISTNSTSIAFGVIEQMPGIVSYEELSKTLLSTGYWVSNSNPCLKVSCLNIAQLVRTLWTMVNVFSRFHASAIGLKCALSPRHTLPKKIQHEYAHI